MIPDTKTELEDLKLEDKKREIIKSVSPINFQAKSYFCFLKMNNFSVGFVAGGAVASLLYWAQIEKNAADKKNKKILSTNEVLVQLDETLRNIRTQLKPIEVKPHIEIKPRERPGSTRLTPRRKMKLHRVRSVSEQFTHFQIAELWEYVGTFFKIF